MLVHVYLGWGVVVTCLTTIRQIRNVYDISYINFAVKSTCITCIVQFNINMPTIQKKLRAAPTSDAQICEKKKDPKKQ
jgi:hypothetical protein